MSCDSAAKAIYVKLTLNITINGYNIDHAHHFGLFLQTGHI